MQENIAINTRDLLMPEFFCIIRKYFPKGTLIQIPNGELYQITTDAFFRKKENRICVSIALVEKKPNGSGLIRKNQSFVVDHFWFFHRNLEIIKTIGGEKK